MPPPAEAPHPDSTGWLSREIAATFALSWPLVLANVAVTFMNTTDLMMLGWLSPEALASGALGYNLYQPVFFFGIGVVAALSPIAAAMVGAGAEPGALRRATHQTLLSALALALASWLILWKAEPILIAIGEAPDLARGAGVYMRGLQWSLAPALLFFAGRSVFAALGRTGPTLVAGLLAVVFNTLANYGLIFGKFGLPALGVFGSGLATTLAQLFMLAILVAYSFFDPRLKSQRLFAGPWRPARKELATLWRLGLPIGATIVAEGGVFSAASLAMGLISHAAIEAHAAVLQIAALAFMVPLGLGQAATVRVGHAYGAGDPAGVSRAGWTAFGLTMAFVALSATTMVAIPRLLIAPFVDVAAPANAEIVALAYSFLRVAAIFQLFDGGQAALANMLRGVHDSRVPLVMALIGYWAIGAPVGVALGFFTPLAGLGLWIGLAAGLAAVAALLLVRWRGKERRGFGVAPSPAGLPDPARSALIAASPASESWP